MYEHKIRVCHIHLEIFGRLNISNHVFKFNPSFPSLLFSLPPLSLSPLLLSISLPSFSLSLSPPSLSLSPPSLYLSPSFSLPLPLSLSLLHCGISLFCSDHCHHSHRDDLRCHGFTDYHRISNSLLHAEVSVILVNCRPHWGGLGDWAGLGRYRDRFLAPHSPSSN